MGRFSWLAFGSLSLSFLLWACGGSTDEPLPNGEPNPPLTEFPDGGGPTAGSGGQGAIDEEHTATGGVGGRLRSMGSDDVGPGVCAQTTLADFVAAIHASDPSLADITTFPSPNELYDGSGVYVLDAPTGFMVVLKRGAHDCPAGCIDNEYYYFDTIDDCQPVLFGHYSTLFDFERNCYNVSGTPLWSIGNSIHPESRCDFDPTPRLAGGTYQLNAVGSGTICETGATVMNANSYEIRVADPDPITGATTVSFIGFHDSLTDVPREGVVVNNRLSVHLLEETTSCINQQNLLFDFDFTTNVGFFLFSELKSDCDDPASKYCKGELYLDLSR